MSGLHDCLRDGCEYAGSMFCTWCGLTAEDAADTAEEVLICIDGGGMKAGCGGKVEYRMPLSGTGKSFPRCDRHWDKRLDRQEQIDRRYPDSAMPPADFDPAYAGESWDGE